MMRERFQVLCVTMGQSDFDLYDRLNANADIIIANQSDHFSYDKTEKDGNTFQMITTNTKGIGLNRNIALSFATAEICLLSDDDMVYEDDLERTVTEEFDSHPEADVIIFNIGTSTPEYGRIPTVIHKYHRLRKIDKLPYGAPRIAFRLDAVKKRNATFPCLFGGNAIYKFGEDTIWLKKLLRDRAKIYLSPVFIGNVSYGNTTSTVSSAEEKVFTQGVIAKCIGGISYYISLLLYAVFRKPKDLSLKNSVRLFKNGSEAFDKLQSYGDYLQGGN